MMLLTIHKQNSGTTVNMTITCCHPGYHFDNKTEVCEHNHNDTNIVRPGENNRYLYTKVRFAGIRRRVIPTKKEILIGGSLYCWWWSHAPFVALQ